MEAIVYVVLAAAAACVIAFFLRTSGAKQAPATTVQAAPDPRVVAVGRFAASIGDVILDAALMRLRQDRIGASVPVEERGEEIRQESLSLYTGSGAALRGAAADLLARWDDPVDDARTFLFSSIATRHPLLGLFVEAGDRAALARLAEGTKVEGAQAIMEVVKPFVDELTSVQALLRERASIVWSVETLLVLALADLEPGSDGERLAIEHVKKVGRDGDPVAARIDAAVLRALDVLATTPFAERKHHEGIFALPFSDRAFGVTVARFIARRDGDAGLAGRARLVARGLWNMHWLAFELARRAEIERASKAFIALVPEAANAVKGGADTRAAALDAFERIAREKLDAEAAGELRALLARIAEGTSQAEVVGGSPGHERRTVAAWKAAAEADLGQEVLAPAV